jgi:menaquinone-dependent protoporphyrinogen oxidase
MHCHPEEVFMKKILVTYASMAGSTAEVAGVIAEELVHSGHSVEVLPMNEVGKLDLYQGVVVGAPMIMGWHRGALHFLKLHRKEFKRIPLAVFVLGMSLTRTGDISLGGVQVCVDEDLPKNPGDPARLTFKERYSMLSHYLRPILRAVHPVKPVSLGFFGGRLEYGRLKWWAVMFAMLVIQAPAGDRRNWKFIRSWAAGLPAALRLETVIPADTDYALLPV